MNYARKAQAFVGLTFISERLRVMSDTNAYELLTWGILNVLATICRYN